MGEITLNTHYFSSNRCICKIIQIILGFIICSLLCTNWRMGLERRMKKRVWDCQGVQTSSFETKWTNRDEVALKTRYGGRSCIGDGRLGFCSGLNFVVLIINIVLFVLNLLNIGVHRLERIYSTICVILFAIASILIIWFIIAIDASRGWLIASAVLIVCEFILFVRDLQILQGVYYS